MQHYELICFDLDGTLVDTAGEIAEGVNRALQEHGLARRPLAEITLLIGAGTRELMLRLLARIFHERPDLSERVQVDAVLASLDRHYALTSGSSAMVYAGAREALRRLRAAGVKTACVSNKELRHARALLRATRLEDEFDLLIGGDSLAHKKPHASVLRHVAQRLGVSTARSAHVGDSQIDVEAARNAGLAAWAVPYGYNGGMPIAQAGPQRIFADLQELASHVLEPAIIQTRSA
ncbi:phosphoglycolate phosphatase [Paucibacter soli]|uniref:phosphoglycolate phosphatase n=1 Tax=Paucibacter soli TaxID=3133433 RepID=UPI0030A7BFB6